MSAHSNAKRIGGRFSKLRQWVVIVQRKKGGAWIVLPPIEPFVLLIRGSAPESPFIEKFRKAVEDVKRAPCVVVQKAIMVDLFRHSEEYHGPRWEMVRLFLRMRDDMHMGAHYAVCLLAPGGIVAAESRLQGKYRQHTTPGFLPREGREQLIETAMLRSSIGAP